MTVLFYYLFLNTSNYFLSHNTFLKVSFQGLQRVKGNVLHFNEFINKYSLIF
jgi:hypothetical protein